MEFSVQKEKRYKTSVSDYVDIDVTVNGGTRLKFSYFPTDKTLILFNWYDLKNRGVYTIFDTIKSYCIDKYQ